MSKPEQKTTTPDSSNAEDLLQLHKEFAAFNTFYACFCDALTRVVMADEVLDAGTAEGISRCARWMKQRMEELRARLAECATSTPSVSSPDIGTS